MSTPFKELNATSDSFDHIHGLSRIAGSTRRDPGTVSVLSVKQSRPVQYTVNLLRVCLNTITGCYVTQVLPQQSAFLWFQLHSCRFSLPSTSANLVRCSLTERAINVLRLARGRPRNTLMARNAREICNFFAHLYLHNG